MSRRVLVLTSSTGSGHDMRARAFAAWADLLYGDQLTVQIEQVIENGSLLGRFGVWLYNTIHKHAPFLHNIYFFIVEVFISSHSRSVTFGGRYYRQRLIAFRPDLVFSVHDSTNRGYFEDAKRILGPGVRCVTYCGEFSGGYGYSRNWVNRQADHFIARTEEARAFAIQLGMDPAKTSLFQHVLPPDAFAKPLDDHEKRELRTQLGLHPGRFTVFLATGGYGANHHMAFLRALLPMADRVQVIVVCGRNQRVFDRITRWSREHPDLPAYVEGYSTQMAEFLQISHAVVSRGGANTTMEALHFGCPLIYNSLGGLMPQELCTVRYFLDHQAARLLRKARDLPVVLESWADFGPDYQQVSQAFTALRHQENPRDLLQAILGPLLPD